MSSIQISRKGILRKRIPLLYFLFFVVAILLYGFFRYTSQSTKISARHAHQVTQPSGYKEPPVQQLRMSGHEFTHPILMNKIREESPALRGLKVEITGYIQERIYAREISTASVYICSLNSGIWTAINDGEYYTPGSLMKLPSMMTFLKQSETNPGFLNRKIYYSKVPDGLPVQTYNSGSIEPGKYYTVRELLDYMISKSDNRATTLLYENISYPVLNDLFAILGLPQVDKRSQRYSIKASEYSGFLNILYNATFISSEKSMLAMSILSTSVFSDGLVAGIPKDVTIAHKFGEAYDGSGRRAELHESGIVFLEGNPYLITVMTRSVDTKIHPEVIAGISKKVYSSMSYLKNDL